MNCDVQLSHQTRQYDLLYIERCDSSFVKTYALFNFPLIWSTYPWIRTFSGHTTNHHIPNQNDFCFILSGYADKVKCKTPAEEVYVSNVEARARSTAWSRYFLLTLQLLSRMYLCLPGVMYIILFDINMYHVML